MQISNFANNFWLQQLQQDLQGLSGPGASAARALQSLPSIGQVSQASSSSSGVKGGSAATASAGSTTGPALLGSDALNWLISSQQTTQSTAQTLANDIVQALNPGGNGVSLQQVATATGQSTSTLSGIFSSIDPNGNGQLTTSDLTSALDNLLQSAQSGAQSLFGHHHHHHHQSDADAASDATSSTSTTAALTSSGTGSTSATTAVGS